jgi:hypothetical protein
MELNEKDYERQPTAFDTPRSPLQMVTDLLRSYDERLDALGRRLSEIEKAIMPTPSPRNPSMIERILAIAPDTTVWNHPAENRRCLYIVQPNRQLQVKIDEACGGEDYALTFIDKNEPNMKRVRTSQ